MSEMQDHVREELTRVLSSPAFAGQERLQKFLSYVVDETLAGRAAELKETTIGFEVFERRADYDPRIDSIVRVQARRLRDKLDEYYAAITPPAIRIGLAKRGYVPEFTSTEPEVAVATPPSTATPEPRTKDHRFAYFVLGGATVVVMAVILGIYSRSLRSPGIIRTTPFAAEQGYHDHPAFSPDGLKIAFDWGGPQNDNTDIYVQALDSDTPVRLTTNPADEARPAWSPDGKQIAFLRVIQPNRGAIVVIPSQGGAERIVSEIALTDAPSRLDWSRDGNTFVTSYPVNPNDPTRGLVLISVANGSQRTLTSPPWGTPGDSEARHSPDGELVAFRRGRATAVDDVFLIPVKGGDPHQITSDGQGISGLDWMPDSKSIVYGSRRTGEAYALWRIPIDKAAPVRLTETTRSAEWPTIAPKGDRIAFSIPVDDENIWRLDLDGKQAPAPVVQSTWIDTNPSISRDGASLAFRSARTGSSEIWVSHADGSEAHRVTHSDGAQCGSPDWSPDNRSIAYDARVHGVPHIYIVARDGGAPKRLTSDEASEVIPHWSRDGRSIYYASSASGSYEIWKKAADGGAAVQLTHKGGYTAQESFDGKSIYFTKGPSKDGLWRQSLAGGTEENVAGEFHGRTWGNWRVAKSGVYFLDFDWGEKPYSGKLYCYNFASGSVLVVARTNGVAGSLNSGLAISPDERSVYFVQADRWGSGIYIAEGFNR